MDSAPALSVELKAACITGVEDIIVAINKDPAAAIFQVADICIVEDLTRFIPALIDVYEKAKSDGQGEDFK